MDRINVGNKLLDHGFSPATKGFEYLADAIVIYKLGEPIGPVYDQIAEQHGTDPRSVERDIRYVKDRTKGFRDLGSKEVIARFKWNLQAEEAKS